MSSYAIRGKKRTFQVLFIKVETSQSIDVNNAKIDIFHYDDIDGSTGNFQIFDVLQGNLSHDSAVGQYHFVWSVPASKPLDQVHYTRFYGTDPSTNRVYQIEEEFVIQDDTPPVQVTIIKPAMTCSFVKGG